MASLNPESAAAEIDMDMDAWAAKASAQHIQQERPSDTPESPQASATPASSAHEDPEARRISKDLQVAAFPASELMRACTGMDDGQKEALKEQIKGWSLSTALSVSVLEREITVSWSKPEAGSLVLTVEGSSVVNWRQ